MDDHAALLRLAGHVKVELFDELTRKKVMETEGHNLFTDYGLSRFRIMSNYLIGAQFGSDQLGLYSDYDCNTALDPRSGAFGFMKNLILTDNASPILASDFRVPGTITGYCSRSTSTSDSDPRSGKQNNMETLFNLGKLKAVFDFATDRANGTHKSVFWATSLSSYDASNRYDNEAYKDFILPSLYRDKADRACIDEAGNVYINFNQSHYPEYYNLIIKCDRSGHVLETFTLTERINNSSYSLVFSVYNNKLYYNPLTNSSTTLCIFDLTTKTTEKAALVNDFQGYVGAIKDGFLYYCCYSSIYKYDLSARTATYKTASAPSGYSVNGLFFFSNSLYVLYTNGYMYPYDYETNTATGTGIKVMDYSYMVENRYNSDFVIAFPAYGYTDTASFRSFTLKKLNTEDTSANMITGKLLDTPVTKNNTQTMKVTYTITIT